MSVQTTIGRNFLSRIEHSNGLISSCTNEKVFAIVLQKSRVRFQYVCSKPPLVENFLSQIEHSNGKFLHALMKNVFRIVLF